MEDTRARVQELGKVGVRHSQISVLVGLDEKDLVAEYESDLIRVSAQADSEVLRALYTMATSGTNATTTIFWAKSRCFDKLGGEPESPNSNPGPQPIMGFTVRRNDGAPNDGI